MKQEILKEVEILRNTEAPYEFSDINDITEEQFELWEKWNDENYQAKEFNGVTVVEYPLGEKVKE